MNNQFKKKIVLLVTFLGIFMLTALISFQSNANSVNQYANSVINDDTNMDNIRKSDYWPDLTSIHIDANWTYTVGNYSWCSGSGTWNDPFLIENVTVDAGGTNHGILINNSITQYFIIRNCTVRNSGTAFRDAGIRLENTNNGTIINSDFSTISLGILLLNSDNNTISHNNVSNCNSGDYGYGIEISEDSDDNIITENIVHNNQKYGIALSSSDRNDIFENDVYKNGLDGIYIYYSDDCNLWGNLVKNNSRYGVDLDYCDNTLVYDNYFIGNEQSNARDQSLLAFHINYWNNTYIGNYWDNYTGVDSNGDGIGEDPYTYFLNTQPSRNPTDYLPIYGDPFYEGGKIHIDGNQISGNKSWIWSSTRAWCSGSGTSEDPYIISDLEIDAGDDGNCILIGNSSVYFKVENCILINSGSGSMDAGIKLDNVVNAELIGNNCSSNYCGISLNLSDNNDITENILQNNYYGIRLNYSDSNTISENNFIFNTENALQENSVGNTFQNNYCTPPLTIINVSSSNADGTYRYQDIIEITIEFSDTVYVTGNPQLTLETGDNDAVVDYTSGNETNQLSFNYTVELDHYSPDLDYISNNALSGTIKGIVGNFANLTLPTPGDPGSLSANKNIIVDARTPSITDVTATNSDGSLLPSPKLFMLQVHRNLLLIPVP